MKNQLLFVLIILLGISTNLLAQNTEKNMRTTSKKATLIYVGDPMCSWCYGFAPELSAAIKQLNDKVEVQLIMGGLRPYNTETMGDLGDFLKDHWQHVAEASQQPFNYDILSDTNFVYDTEPPSRAVLVVRKLKPEMELPFFKAVQKAFYADNKNTHDVATYTEIAKTYGIDAANFKAEFESEAMKQAVRDDFANAGEMGVRGFPTVILQKNEKLFLICNGYAKAAEVVKGVEELLER